MVNIRDKQSYNIKNIFEILQTSVKSLNFLCSKVSNNTSTLSQYRNGGGDRMVGSSSKKKEAEQHE